MDMGQQGPRISSPDFGKGINAFDLISSRFDKLPSLSSIDTQIYFQSTYEIAYGINTRTDLVSVTDENGVTRNVSKYPLACISKHPAEDIEHGSLLEIAVNQYREARIKENYHMSLIDYLNNTPEDNRTLRRLAREANNKEGRAVDNITNQLDQLVGKG